MLYNYIPEMFDVAEMLTPDKQVLKKLIKDTEKLKRAADMLVTDKRAMPVFFHAESYAIEELKRTGGCDLKIEDVQKYVTELEKYSNA